MARPSRSSKKQPAFDPSELEDLIFSPAVGKGVGSHLVTAPTVVTSSLAPVVTSGSSSAAHLATVAGSTSSPATRDMTTVVRPMTSFARRPRGESPPTAGTTDPTLVTSDVATVAPATPKARPLWITEHGDLVSEARVKRIRLAQDVINSAEECVYDTLWNAKLVSTDDRESCRLVQAGYDYLVKRTRLARKTIQRIIAKLLEKDFIAIETRADIYQRAPTIYRVFSYKAVLDRHVRKGRLYVAKMGPGFSYARPLDSNTSSVARPAEMSDMTTVARSNMSSVVTGDVSTMVPETTVTVVKNNRSTVVKMSGHLLDTNVLDSTTSSSAYPVVYAALNQLGPIDDDAVVRLVAACRAQAADCTESEIVHFVREKASHIQKRESRVHSPIGFLLTAVPKCFSGEVLKKYRNDRMREQESESSREAEEQASVDRWRREQEAALLDPSVSEQEKHLIRLCLGLNRS
ncbi:MAG: hypothetical protein JO061_02315 [Acidobacteriaceae bacterium]|nr:hypothetical protein [Acidobacteriaceae bacterium]